MDKKEKSVKVVKVVKLESENISTTEISLG